MECGKEGVEWGGGHVKQHTKVVRIDGAKNAFCFAQSSIIQKKKNGIQKQTNNRKNRGKTEISNEGVFVQQTETLLNSFENEKKEKEKFCDTIITLTLVHNK